jgi:hypothetical protein
MWVNSSKRFRECPPTAGHVVLLSPWCVSGWMGPTPRPRWSSWITVSRRPPRRAATQLVCLHGHFEGVEQGVHRRRAEPGHRRF